MLQSIGLWVFLVLTLIRSIMLLVLSESDLFEDQEIPLQVLVMQIDIWRRIRFRLLGGLPKLVDVTRRWIWRSDWCFWWDEALQVHESVILTFENELP
jgi:hypothetical protein